MSRIPSTTDVFHAVADANRRALIDQLADRELPVGDLVEHSGLSYSAVSQHLAVLLEVGLVHRRQDGRQRLYTLNATPLREIHDWTTRYEAFWRSKLRRLHKVVDEET
jgi:DNA-binding transcriptional ArsR family regulator